jgi:hypothetical protein
MGSNFLTKTRFKVGYECPTKLYYLDDKSYGNNNVDNSFLAALSEGGFQVGELAKLYHPGGTEITAKDKVTAVKQTAELLQQEKAIIYEAAIQFENLFVKADILIKNKDHVELIEVKAKSFDPREDDAFYTKTSLKKGEPKLSSSWEPYLVDVAYQTYVLQKAFPDLKTRSALMLADKSAVASVDGLNQKFLLQKSAEGRTSVKVAADLQPTDLGKSLLIKINVDAEVKVVWDMAFEGGLSFEKTVARLSKLCKDPQFNTPVIGGHCKSCEFRINPNMKAGGLKSGFEKCWSHALNLTAADFAKPLVFDVWNFRKAGKLLEDGKYLMEQIDEEDISPSEKAGEVGLSSSQRQWLQVEKEQKRQNEPFLDAEGLAREMKSWTYPLHFIDFETTMVAIPFHRGRHPYEQIAFQFSHHVVGKDGVVTHQDEYINRVKGHFPNFDFVRALKKALSHDQGTIFRYATHENTVLCQIRQQLLDSEENIADRDELVAFIESITTGGSGKAWVGPRNMVDLCDLVKKYFYHPLTKGSNSIKKVLPAILSTSKFLQQKYARPIYGSAGGTSKNFKDWAWIQLDLKGQVIDPYKTLPPVFTDLDLETMDSLITEGSIADGGAAMTAYARMQFTEMSETESDKVAKALLKYCELDTFAMVMIYEYWKHQVESVQRQAA